MFVKAVLLFIALSSPVAAAAASSSSSSHPNLRATSKNEANEGDNDNDDPQLSSSSSSSSRHLLNGCDEPSSEPESKEKPMDVFNQYKAKNKFPVKAIGQCGDPDDGYEVDGQPASPARPSLFTKCMFGVDPADETSCIKHFNDHDLPIIDTYYDEQGRPVDVYETLETANIPVDIFGETDTCRPTDYNSTGGFFVYYSPNAGIDPYFPAPTIKNCRGRQGLVRFENTANRARISVHLHGAASAAPYDGWADDVTDIGYAKNYFYPNNRATTLWYHDHSVHITSDNAYSGLAGQFIIKECSSDLENRYLPSEEYSIPFVLKDATLQSMGNQKYDLLYDKLRDHKNDLYGDINTVNGVAWPKLQVDRLTYRLRTLDVSITRPFYIKFLAVSEKGQQAWIPFWIVQTDGGNLKDMRRTYSLFNAVAERFQILVNFNAETSSYPTLTNSTAAAPDFWQYVYAVNDFGDSSKAPPLFCKTHLLARFDLDTISDGSAYNASKRLVDEELEAAPSPPDVLQALDPDDDTGIASFAHPFKAMRNLIPQSVIDKMAQRARAGQADRTFDFGRSGGRWAVNGCTWEEEECRIIANPSRNGYELWKLVGHGGWFHPVHIHLIDFLVLHREGDNNELWDDYDPLDTMNDPGDKFVTLTGNSDGLRPWEVDGAKDVVHLGHGQTVWVLTLWGPHDGDFMFHCHNLVHEDNDMMVAAGVGRTSNVGEDEVFTADGDREDYLLDTENQSDAYYDDKGLQEPIEDWQANSPGTEFERNFGAPYSPQFYADGTDEQEYREIRQGFIHPNLRSGMGDRARNITVDYSTIDATGRLDGDYVCNEICMGIYNVFYPSSEHHYQFRPTYNVSTENPIHNNVWAVSPKFGAFKNAKTVPFTKVNDAKYLDHALQGCSCVSTDTAV